VTMTETPEALKTTCLHDAHLALGARMVPFGGWHMPVQYSGILDEHRAVRTAAGCFDVSHMRRIDFTGPDCVPYLQRIFTCDVASIEPGQGKYNLICVENGGILDDTILYRRAADAFWLVCNAANSPAVQDWLNRWKAPEHRVTLADRTAETGMIALQGPQAEAHMASLGDPAFARKLAYFRWAETRIADIEAVIARTGYTGEDGFEIVLPADRAPELWDILMRRGVKPCGLGARDTLRLEAALPLHGNDISLKTTPVAAGLLWTVALDKGDFLGRSAILREKEEGPAERLIGFELTERGIPRQHHRLLHQGADVGEVTSGTLGPTLNKAIGMGYVRADLAKIGTEITIDIRGALTRAKVVRRPFYKRAG